MRKQNKIKKINKDAALFMIVSFFHFKMIYPKTACIETKKIGSTINRESYMSVRVLLNVLNELSKRDKMRGLPSILCLFRNE